MAIVFLGLVIFSPLGLRALDRSFNLNWSDLSNIGQTYGAVAALINALALGGVVVSLLYQARDVNANRSQAIRSFQFELIRLELEHPDLMWASGAPWGLRIPAEYGTLRQHIFVHMWLSFWESEFLLREMSAEAVRLAAKELFSGKPAREYWESVGDWRISVNEGRSLQFIQIIDDAYKNAAEISLPTVPVKKVERQERGCETVRYIPNFSFRTLLSYAASAGAGVLLGRMLHQKNNPTN